MKQSLALILAAALQSVEFIADPQTQCNLSCLSVQLKQGDFIHAEVLLQCFNQPNRAERKFCIWNLFHPVDPIEINTLVLKGDMAKPGSSKTQLKKKPNTLLHR